MTGRPDPFVAVALAAICAVAAVLQPDTIWGVMGGLLLALVLPGWSLSHMLVPGAERLGRAVLALGLSVASCVLMGLLLAALDQINATGWAVGLAGMSALAAIIPDPDVRVKDRRLPPWRGHASALLFITAAVGLTVTAGLRAYQGAAAQRDGTTVVQLWMLPRTSSSQVTLGIRNAGPKPGSFTLEVRSDEGVIASWPAIELDSRQTWERDLSLAVQPARSRDRPMQVEAVLFRLDGAVPGPIRRVTAWADPPGDGPENGSAHWPGRAPSEPTGSGPLGLPRQPDPNMLQPAALALGSR